MWSSVNPEKSYSFSLGFGVDPSPQLRYVISVGSVAVSLPTNADQPYVKEYIMLRIYRHEDMVRYQSYSLSVLDAKAHEYLDHEDITFSWMSSVRMPFTLANLASIFAGDDPRWGAYLTNVPTR